MTTPISQRHKPATGLGPEPSPVRPALGTPRRRRMWALLEDKCVGHRPASTPCHDGLPWQVAAGPGYCGVSSPPLNIGVRHLNKVLIFLGHTFRPITRTGLKSDVPRLLGCIFFFFFCKPPLCSSYGHLVLTTQYQRWDTGTYFITWKSLHKRQGLLPLVSLGDL